MLYYQLDINHCIKAWQTLQNVIGLAGARGDGENSKKIMKLKKNVI